MRRENTEFSSEFLSAAFIIGVTGRILREPPAQNAHLLGQQLMDAPETRERGGPENGGADRIVDKERKKAEKHAGERQDPPAFLAPIILHLDDNRVAYPDNQENGRSDNDTCKVHEYLFVSADKGTQKLLIIRYLCTETNLHHTMKTITEPSRNIPVRAEVDVLVVGGGPSGIMAARGAAGDGLHVMLLESRGYLGGNLTIGLPILAFLDINGKQCIRGYAQDFVDRLAVRGAASGHKRCALHMSLTIIDPEESKNVALELMEESGVEVLMSVFVADVIKEGDTVKGVVIESKNGREAILARTVIDCSGDGDVAARAGALIYKGDEKGGMQPPTLMYSMRGVDVGALRKALVERHEEFDMDRMPPEQFREGKFITVGLRRQIRKAESAGIRLPVARTILITGLRPDEIWVNMTRVGGIDATLPESYTRGEIAARAQIKEVNEYLRRFVPGFGSAWMDKVAPFLGIRESRQIGCEYMLTGEDILESRRFSDCIAVAGYPVDIHHSVGADCTMLFARDNYDIPYRCLVPKGLHHLLVSGRCAGYTHEAMASARVMSTCMAVGQAAGTAARLALKQKVEPARVDVDSLRAELIAEGAYLGQLG